MRELEGRVCSITILIAQRNDQLARTSQSSWDQWWTRIYGLTLGYGYQPWRALLFLVEVVLVSCVLAVVLGSHGALVQTNKTATPGRPCTFIQQFSVGMDLNLPVGTSLALAFGALFAAGFAGAISKK